MTSKRSGEALALGGGALLLIGSWVVVTASDAVPPMEVCAFEAVNRLPDGLWPFVWAPMQIGSFAGAIAVPGLVMATTRRPALAAAALAASQTAFWTSKLIKRRARRGRPEALLHGVRRREHASGLGYVSGHAAVAFALAAAIAPSAPRPWRPALFGGAAFVGLARQYAGVHLPLDAVGGAGSGLLAGTLARWAFGLRLGGTSAAG